MIRRISIYVLFTALLTASSSAEVLKIIIDGPIQPITEEYVSRALVEAQHTNASALLVELNTPGGLESSTRSIIEKFLGSSIPVIVYVTPSGHRAASAGFFLLQAADIAAMAPGTNTGSAHPVLFSPLGGEVKVDDTMMKKIENDSAAFMRSIATKRGRNVDVAESAVRESKSFTEQEALQQKLIDCVAANEADLFQKLHGKQIKLENGQTVTLNLAGQTSQLFDMTLKQRILGSLVMNPNLIFVLLAIGALCIYAEMNHPGAIIPGTVGFIAIVLAVFALNLLPFRYMALVLIVSSFVFFALEAKLASHGVLGAGGIVALTLGGMLLVDGPIPEMRVHLLTALAVSIPLGLITVFLMTIALKARRGKVVTGEQGLVGEIGMTQTALSPAGKVFVHGEIWDATAASPIAAGERVVVRSVNGLQLTVEAFSAATSRTAELLTRT